MPTSYYFENYLKEFSDLVLIADWQVLPRFMMESQMLKALKFILKKDIAKKKT